MTIIEILIFFFSYPIADPCLNNPCLNNGTCYVDFSTTNYTFFCVCPIPKQYEGKDCGTPSKNTITTTSTTATAPCAAAATAANREL